MVTRAKKQKDMHNAFRAKVIRVNASSVVLSILNGPRKGAQRKVVSHTVTMVSAADSIHGNPFKRQKLQQAPDAPAGSAGPPQPDAEAAAPAAPMAAPETTTEAPNDVCATDGPDDHCVKMFGDLELRQ